MLRDVKPPHPMDNRPEVPKPVGEPLPPTWEARRYRALLDLSVLIKEQRKFYSQSELQEMTGVSRQTLYLIEKDKTDRTVNLATALKIVNVLVR